jgi:hypothetical protein
VDDGGGVGADAAGSIELDDAVVLALLELLHRVLVHEGTALDGVLVDALVGVRVRVS